MHGIEKSQVKMKTPTVLARVLFAVLTAFVTLAGMTGTADAQNVRPPDNAVTSGGPPQIVPEEQGNYNIEMWSQLRRGVNGTVSIPDKKAGILVDSSGENWRALRNGPLPVYGAYAMAGMIGLLALFFLLRGRIRVEHGFAGRTIERFSDFERTGHWLLATSFIILALTGLNVLYGRYVLLPVIGKEAFASIALTGKWLHNYVAFAFMAGLLMTFLTWVSHNFPHPRDLVWLLKGGGLFGGGHPDAKKFNGGQKILFWLVMIGGFSLSLSGLQLLLPYDLPLFAKTFSILNTFGLDLPTQLTANEEQQLATTWHGIVALGLVVVIIAHIYIGSIGMEGAFDAMGSGEVDLNWAKEHHNLWVEEELAKEASGDGASSRPAPAE
ncbi:MAG: formate dehydrogenase subunit gamma [Alphaproteobacteria bacterium]|nr:formate dehydrogenase subunit gamma [Alphaproteobacteria bacterium]